VWLLLVEFIILLYYHICIYIYIYIYIYICGSLKAMCKSRTAELDGQSQSQSQSYIATDGQSISKSWCRAPWPDIYYSLTVTVLFFWGALSHVRAGLSFVYAAGPRQRSLSPVWVIWDSWPYFTVSDLRLPFSSHPMTRRVTVEVFEPASTRPSQPATSL
jgi:hypothetical protein